MAFIMTLWIGYSAVLKSSSQWQLKKMKINKSWPEIFIFKIHLIVIDIHKVIINAIF